MKYIKFVFVLLLILFLSGCDINYTLVISDDNCDEYIDVSFKDDIANMDDINKKYNPLHHSDDIFYDQDVERKNGITTVKLHYKYSFEDFKNANSFNNAFNQRNIRNDDDTISFNLSDISGLNLTTNFDIKIKTNNKVLYSNADQKVGNTYIWHVKHNNKKKFKLQFKIKKGSIEKKDKNVYLLGYIILGIVILILIFTIFITVTRVKKNNNFS